MTGKAPLTFTRRDLEQLREAAERVMRKMEAAELRGGVYQFADGS